MNSASSIAEVFATLERLAVEHRDRTALVPAHGRPLSYGALQAAVAAAATNLQRQGMRRGDAVSFSVRPSIEAIVLILGIVRAGGVVVAADPGMGAANFEARMALIRPAFVMAESILYALSSQRMLRRLPPVRRLQLPQVGRMPNCRFVRVGPWLPGTPAALNAAELMRPPRGGVAPPVDLSAGDPVFIVFTSGTTAAPRAVVHTAGSISAMLNAAGYLAELGEDSVVVTDQLHSILPALLAGSRVVLPAPRTTPGQLLRLLHRSEATQAFAVPSEVQRLIDHCEREWATFPGTLRQLVMGSGPAGRPLLARLRPLVPDTASVLSVYGLTEMGPVACVTMEEKLEWSGAGDLVGAPLPGCGVRIDADGELLVAGERLCAGYLGEAPMHEAGTGDLARFDDRGRIVLLGRRKDMIIRGNANIYPALYEETIDQVPGVARSALVGVWDDRDHDERVVLVVEPDRDVQDTAGLKRRVEQALRASPLIDDLARPDEIVVMPLPESGRANKIDKQALRQLLGDRRQ